MAITSSCLFGQEMSKQLDSYMNALTELNRFSGTVLVAKDGTILLNRGYGLASQEFDVPNTPQTYFRICSISKMVTAVAILQLQEKGLLKVSDSLSKYLPDYPRGNGITIHHLLTHTSGISSCNFPLEMTTIPTSVETITAFYKTKPLESKPGADFHYSNGNYCILSYIIEKISGKKFESYIKEHIAKPAGMNESSLMLEDYGILKNRATGYCFNEKNSIVQGDYAYTSNFSGAGGLCFTALDLYRFAHALATNILLNKASLQLMFTHYQPEQNYGYGCSVETVNGRRCIIATGASSNGFRSSLSIFPDDGIYIIILSNILSSWVYDARDALTALVFEKPAIMPSAKKMLIDPVIYDDYKGAYDHPLSSNYHISKKEKSLYTHDNIELIPFGMDQFCPCNGTNILYTFARDEKGAVCQLQIKGGSRYYEIRCNKIEQGRP